MTDFRMPSLGADMDAGTLLEWRVAPGDRVERGQIVAVVDTEKAAIEVEAFSAGVVEQLLVEPGTKVPVGTVLATLRGEGEPLAQVVAAPERARASPAARKRARELGVELATLAGTGPEGTVTLADVERARPAVSRSDRLRNAIAAAMARSNREIPHYYLASTIDLRPALDWLRQVNATRPPAERLLLAALELKAVALALRETPALNGFWQDGPRPSAAIHVGVVVAVRGGGVVVPAIHDTDRRSLDELMRALRDQVARARAGRLRSSELSDGTVTVTALGEPATADAVFGVVFPPQLALIGLGSVVERPWIVGGAVVARPLVTVTLAADHRATDGLLGARFLSALERRLRAPESL